MAVNQIPHNIDAEREILGCILYDGDYQSDILEELNEEDFYQESHRVILSAMKAVFASGKAIDAVTLVDRLQLDGKLERAGGFQYVSDLAQLSPSDANYKQYLSIVRRDSVNRSLIRAAKEIIENSMNSDDEEKSVSFAEKRVYDVSMRGDTKALTGLEDGEAVQEVLDRFEAIQANPNVLRGIETGFRHLDRMTNGLQRSDLIVIAARPGMGKTSLAMNIVENACLRKGYTAAIFSLEMPRTQLVQRLICSYGEVSMEKAQAGKLVQKDWKNLLLAADKMKKSKVFIDDSSRITPAQILSKCRRLKSAEGRLDLIMIDYIQLMEGELKGKSSPENRQQEIASITRDLKIMAKELNVPVIALSQLRRIQTKEPQLSDLRESGAIEQDADIVMFISRPDALATKEELASGKIVKGAAELIIAKHRNGAPGRVQLRFIGESTKFVDVEAQGEPNEEPQYRRKSEWKAEDGEGAFDDGGASGGEGEE